MRGHHDQIAAALAGVSHDYLRWIIFTFRDDGFDNAHRRRARREAGKFVTRGLGDVRIAAVRNMKRVNDRIELRRDGHGQRKGAIGHR